MRYNYISSTTGTAEFCSPDYMIEVVGRPLQITAPNGMCSYGIGKVGTYNSTFISMRIADQIFNNPAGRYNYKELIDQAMSQTYVVTDLFTNSDVPESLFSMFLPNETMPTTEFLSAPAPTNPNVGGSASSLVLSYFLVFVVAYSTLALLL